MADIKFRAWDKLTETMRYVLCIDWVNSLVDLNGGIIERKYNNSDEDEVILMQYTGLKDNNGKEIYEGDILIDEHNEEYCEVIFECGNFVCNFETDSIDLSNISDELIVIGNTYENEELIKSDLKFEIIDEVQDV